MATRLVTVAFISAFKALLLRWRESGWKMAARFTPRCDSCWRWIEGSWGGELPGLKAPDPSKDTNPVCLHPSLGIKEPCSSRGIKLRQKVVSHITTDNFLLFTPRPPSLFTLARSPLLAASPGPFILHRFIIRRPRSASSSRRPGRSISASHRGNKNRCLFSHARLEGGAGHIPLNPGWLKQLSFGSSKMNWSIREKHQASLDVSQVHHQMASHFACRWI